jgi:hypothetical protein
MGDNLGEVAIDIIGGLINDSASQCRYAGEDTEDFEGTIETVLTTGIEATEEQSEEGSYKRLDGLVRYKLTDEPDSWGVKDSDDPGDDNGKTEPAIMGQVIEVLLAGGTDWDNAIRCRVRNRVVIAGMVRLNVGGEFEEE